MTGGGNISFAAALLAAGLDAATPISLAAVVGGRLMAHASGHWPDGAAVTVDDLFYGGSLTKQLTGAALALLVLKGAGIADTPARQLLPELPNWADFTLEQLAHHLSGLPAAGVVESKFVDRHWTDPSVMSAIADMKAPEVSAGTQFIYSNIGYVVLARAIEALTDERYATFVGEQVLRPLRVEGLHLVQQSTPPDLPQIQMMGRSLPLSTGDGGLWSTASGFARWLSMQNADALGVERLVTRPGRFADGALTDYGWGLGLRSFNGMPLYLHGGGWQGAYAKAMRAPTLGLSVAGFAADTSRERIGVAVDRLFALLAKTIA